MLVVERDMQDETGPNQQTTFVILGHGASGNAESMRPWVEGLAARGVDGRAIDLPRGKAEPAVPVFTAAIAEAETSRGLVVAGGHSFGGRVASLAAAGAFETVARAAPGADAGHTLRPVAAVLLLSYPLHRPGDPSAWEARTAHWPALRCPVLLLSGESDPFARVDLLREAARRLPDGQLVTYPRVGHGLRPVLDDALDRAAAFLHGVAEAANGRS